MCKKHIHGIYQYLYHVDGLLCDLFCMDVS